MSVVEKSFIFVEKSVENVNSVLKILEKRLPKSALPYNVMKLMGHGFLKASDVNIFSFAGELDDTNRVFLCLQLNLEYPKMVLISPPDQTTDEMLEAFVVGIFDIWRRTPWYEIEAMDLWPRIESILGPRKPSLVIDNHSFMTLFPFEPHLYSTPEQSNVNEASSKVEFELKNLSPDDVDTVIQHWYPEGPPEKKHFVEDALKLGSAGLYTKGQDSLASFAVATLIGSINCLHTMDEHRRKGFAAIVVRSILKQLSNLGIVPCAHVVNGNSQSENLFYKLGFICSEQRKVVSFEGQT